MTYDELEYKEVVLRKSFMDKLDMLNVDGVTDIDTIRCIKMYGALWHYTHQLLLAENNSTVSNRGTTAIDTVSMTGLKMTGSKQ